MIRVLPYADADGATNMAADEALVRTAAEGVASLRFYGWTTATLSLGYFQPYAVRLMDSRLTSLPWVRRPSSGGAIVHDHELTYAIALPTDAVQQSKEPWMPRMHRVIAAALADLGLSGKIETMRGEPSVHGNILCFQQHTAGDLLSAGRKVVGSAQRKYRQALMQHGSILLRQSAFTPHLPGLFETAGADLTVSAVQAAIVGRLAEDTGWVLAAIGWTPEENAWIKELVTERYATSHWNERR